MFKNSTLIRRTIILVLGALFSSALLSSLAFVLAGKNSAFNEAIERSYTETDAIVESINNSDISLKSTRILLETSSRLMDRYFFLYDVTGAPVYSVNEESIPDNIKIGRDYYLNSMANDNTEYTKLLDTSSLFVNILVIRQQVTFEKNDYTLVSVTEINDNGSNIDQYLNILLLSTLAAALTMMLPTLLLVERIIEPIQDVNEVAKEYGRGDFSKRADENYKGEVGELAASFNSMADKLSKSISDLTVERNRLEDIFNVISEGIVDFNEDGGVTFTNDIINNIFNKVPKKNLFTERLHLIPFDEVWLDLDECLATGEKKERTLEGPDYAYNITIVPKFDPDNREKCIGATGFFRDITEELKLERTRRDYVANISHELRTPLQTLRGLIEPLADGMVKNEEDRLRYYNIILNETLRLSRLIDDMLELSKLQSRTLAFKTFPFDLNILLSELETKFMPVMKESQIKFKVMFTTGKLPTVMGNPDRVEQILVILLDNAKKYTPSGGSITISAEFDDMTDKVYISVADTGQGIHEYDINHIFDRFFKADRARGKKGTGLGLSIAKELLAYMGEEITVKSIFGEGTTFTFTLKRAEAGNAWY